MGPLVASLAIGAAIGFGACMFLCSLGWIYWEFPEDE